MIHIIEMGTVVDINAISSAEDGTDIDVLIESIRRGNERMR